MAIENSTSFILQSIEGDAERGGWQSSASFANDQDEAVYWRITNLFYEGEGNGAKNDIETAMIGQIIPQVTAFDIGQSGTTINLATMDYFLNQLGLQGIYFVNVGVAPTHPHQIQGMNLGKIVQHIIEQHCGVSSTAFIQNSDATYSANSVGGIVDTSDIDTTNSTTVDVFTVRQANSLWQAIKDIAKNEFYVAYMSKDNAFHYKAHPQYDTTLPSIQLDLNTTNLVNQPEVNYREIVQFDQMVLRALTDSGNILEAKYPNSIVSSGRRRTITNLRCNQQGRLDNLVQRVYELETRQYDIKVQIAGPWGLALELYDRVSVTYSGTARNGTSFVFTAEPFFVSNIRVDRIGSFGSISTLSLTQQNRPGIYS